jgi:aerobic-type carbon monoxide dehydrogenase small subunit (CoxS/CutS family)
MRQQLQINGTAIEVDAPPGSRLLDVLRELLGLTGAKEACGRGECGACTVLINGKPVTSCLVMVETVAGPVTTVEGLAETASDLRQAFADKGAFQCGFCTPGQIVQAAALLQRPDWPKSPCERERFVRLQMSGNICRCTGYTGIVDAILHTAAARASGAREESRV